MERQPAVNPPGTGEHGPSLPRTPFPWDRRSSPPAGSRAKPSRARKAGDRGPVPHLCPGPAAGDSPPSPHLLREWRLPALQRVRPRWAGLERAAARAKGQPLKHTPCESRAHRPLPHWLPAAGGAGPGRGRGGGAGRGTSV